VNRIEPQPKPAKNLKPPVILDEYAMKFWRHYSKRLKKLELLSEIDTHLLAAGAQWWSIEQRALEELKNSLTDNSPANGNCAKPQIAIAKVAFNSVRAILAEFGIGPASRSRIDIPPPKRKEDPFENFKASRYFQNR
jgi:P27 family predicted phage terminase small subunit